LTGEEIQSSVLAKAIHHHPRAQPAHFPEVAVKYLDRIANVAIIVAVVVFLFLAARGDFGWRKAPTYPGSGQVPSNNLVGTTVKLPGVEFPQGSKLACARSLHAVSLLQR
jgi:hypothetical protein